MSDSAKTPQAAEVDFSRAYRPAKTFISTPFDSSAINYEKFTEQLLAVLDALGEGAVVAIDGPWGSGKTYYAKNFEALLKNAGWKAVYVDAFAFDYVEDPFIYLASAIRDQADDQRIKRNFLNAASQVGKALLPVTAKALIKLGTGSLIDVDKTEAVLAEAVSSAAEKAVEARIREFEKEKASVEKFKGRLAELAAKAKEQTSHPLVVFIDELDRCRPDFALRTLERIKHFFEVPGLSFVLFLHTDQLRYAVTGLYGEIDAEAYLRKFIHFTLALPRREGVPGEISESKAYIRYLAQKISMGPTQQKLKRFAEMLGYLAPALHMTLRDIERAFLTFILSRVSPGIYDQLVDILAYTICLKVLNPSLYHQVLNRTVSVTSPELESFIQSATSRLPESYRAILRDVIETHLSGEANQDAVNRWAELRMFTGPSVESAFRLVSTPD